MIFWHFLNSLDFMFIVIKLISERNKAICFYQLCVTMWGWHLSYIFIHHLWKIQTTFWLKSSKSTLWNQWYGVLEDAWTSWQITRTIFWSVYRITISMSIDEPINTANICLLLDKVEMDTEYWKRREEIDEDGIKYAWSIRSLCWYSLVAKH